MPDDKVPSESTRDKEISLADLQKEKDTLNKWLKGWLYGMILLVLAIILVTCSYWLVTTVVKMRKDKAKESVLSVAKTNLSVAKTNKFSAEEIAQLENIRKSFGSIAKEFANTNNLSAKQEALIESTDQVNDLKQVIETLKRQVDSMKLSTISVVSASGSNTVNVAAKSPQIMPAFIINGNVGSGNSNHIIINSGTLIYTSSVPVSSGSTTVIEKERPNKPTASYSTSVNTVVEQKIYISPSEVRMPPPPPLRRSSYVSEVVRDCPPPQRSPFGCDIDDRYGYGKSAPCPPPRQPYIDNRYGYDRSAPCPPPRQPYIDSRYGYGRAPSACPPPQRPPPPPGCAPGGSYGYGRRT